jgi:hypothetical protein
MGQDNMHHPQSLFSQGATTTRLLRAHAVWLRGYHSSTQEFSSNANTMASGLAHRMLPRSDHAIECTALVRGATKLRKMPRAKITKNNNMLVCKCMGCSHHPF